ncbi:MAG: SurA N-terminal domain-containing protein, partial [Bryobacteraceae bacterium]
MKRNCVVPFLLLAGLPAASCKHTPPANVAAEVNNHAITYTELEKAYQSQYPQQPDGISQDLVMSQKLDLLGNLITKEIMLQRAEKSGLTATDA